MGQSRFVVNKCCKKSAGPILALVLQCRVAIILFSYVSVEGYTYCKRCTSFSTGLNSGRVKLRKMLLKGCAFALW